VDLIYFILCAYGLTSILTFSKILNPIRPNHYFFKCPQCMGFWVGAFLFSINEYTELFTFERNISNLLLLSCLSSGTSYALAMLVDDCGFKVRITGDNNDS